MRPTFVLLAALSVLMLPAVALGADRSDPGFVFHGSALPDPIITDGGVCPGTPIPSLPFNDPGNSCGSANTITNYTGGSCGVDLPFPYPGEDEVYQITLAGGNNVAFSLDITGSAGDLVLFLLTTCGSGASCTAHSQDSIGPGVGPELIAAASYPAGTYFLYIDSYYAVGAGDNCGTYTLSVTGTLPAELIEFAID